MKKTYIAPSVEIENIILEGNVAGLTVGSKGTEGDDIDTKVENTDADWNIWSEEGEE